MIATFNRVGHLRELLHQLSAQSLSPADFEVVVVDDGSLEPVAPQLGQGGFPFALHVLTQKNAGAAAARHAGVLQARAPLLVLLDDDMDVPSHFLAAHLAEHAVGSRVVLGQILPGSADQEAPLFLRYHAGKIERLAEAFGGGRERPRGVHLYTGNVSLRRADYLRVGGLDPALRRSEDIELGVRLEQAGVQFAFSGAAFSVHQSDRTSAAAWRRESRTYGEVGLRIAHKHPRRTELHPYRFFREVNPFSLPFLAASLVRPDLGTRFGQAGFLGARLLERCRLDRAALKATAFVHGLDYFSGVGEEAGGLGAILAEGLHFLVAGWAEGDPAPELRRWLALAALDLQSDHQIALQSRPSYSPRGGLATDLVHRIGLQIMAAYRLMQACRRGGRLLEAKAISRLIRHAYGSDIHWDAELAPGVHIVHGMGVAISGQARVGTGSVLSQHVTLGEGITPSTRLAGSPTVEDRVHIGPGATLLGPITIGSGSKIMPGALVMESVPANSIVEVAAALVRPRRTHDGAFSVPPRPTTDGPGAPGLDPEERKT